MLCCCFTHRATLGCLAVAAVNSAKVAIGGGGGGGCGSGDGNSVYARNVSVG